MLRLYADLTKFGIGIFVMLAGLAGYATSFSVEQAFNWQHILSFLGGLYFLSSGSLALNQVQEWRQDQKMPRTAKRPIASGKIKPAAAGILAWSFIFVGVNLLFQISEIAGALGLLSLVLYNGLYVYWWKPKWVFAAVPGAIPGALPVTIGYAANSADIFSSDSIYLFMVLFLWQMPHFWVLAIKFREDYDKAGFPVLPTAIGLNRALYHTGLWTFVYVGSAIAAPFFVHTSWIYLAIVIPIGAKIMIEFFRFFKSEGKERWLAFFMWINISVLIYLFVPVIDKWHFLITGQ